MIIGITGTNGAGKGTVVEYLVKHRGFAHYSARKYIEAEISRRGLPFDRNSTNLVGNDMRAKHGFDYWDKLIFEDVQKDGHERVVIESLRNLEASKKFKEKGGVIWGVDADKHKRYERAVLRGSGTDKVSFEEFCQQEDREMSQTAIHDMNVFGVMQIADHIFTNNGTEEDLFAQVEEVLKSYDSH